MLVAWQTARRDRVESVAADDFGPVGSFAFSDKDGRAVTDRDLSGKVWIAACFFTCCT
jgi:cytochrome oxidase Cu insertion factor (SCO1/SenC/PrrC family)